MKKEDILKIENTPITSPAYIFPPTKSTAEMFEITYESDPQAIRNAVPEPLVPDGSNNISFIWFRFSKSLYGSNIEEVQVNIPCIFNGEPCNYFSQLYLNNLGGIVGGREFFGYPKKWGIAKLEVEDSRVGGTLYASDTTRVAVGSMCMQEEITDHEVLRDFMKPQVNLKIIPDPDGSIKIAQLTAINFADVVIEGTVWRGEAMLSLASHAEMPVNDFPVRKVIGGKHFTRTLVIPFGKVIYDYLK